MFELLLVQDWPIERTLEQCERNCSGKTTDSRKGSIHKPLLSIPFDQVIIDTLHLFLIMGLLLHQVDMHFIQKNIMMLCLFRLHELLANEYM